MKPQLPPTDTLAVDILNAHALCSQHRDSLRRSRVCGCFYCLGIYPFALISAWTDRGQTALCPECGIDSVIGSASGYPVDEEFLRHMKAHWFGKPER